MILFLWNEGEKLGIDDGIFDIRSHQKHTLFITREVSMPDKHFNILVN
jgi:hypothetical protein